MDKSPTPTMIQNRNLTEGLTTPEIDARLYESLLERTDYCLEYYGVRNAMSIELITKIKPQVLPDALPKFELRHATKMGANDGLSFQNRVYRPTVWARRDKKWVPYVFVDEARGQGRFNISKELLGSSRGLLSEIGDIVDSFSFGHCVVLRLAAQKT